MTYRTNQLRLVRPLTHARQQSRKQSPHGRFGVVAHRTYQDSAGRVWEVWSVTPTRVDPRRPGALALSPDAERRRRQMVPATQKKGPPARFPAGLSHRMIERWS